MNIEQQILSAEMDFSFVLAEALTEPSAVAPDAGVYFNNNLDTQQHLLQCLDSVEMRGQASPRTPNISCLFSSKNLV